VLSRLDELGQGELRQQELAESMGWDKARLSHHLKRMEERALVERRSADGRGVLVALTKDGERALKAARPEHARSVRRHLIERLGKEERRRLLASCEALVAEGGGSDGR
jgi:DNA-binding MarR family transcriptional regulator